MELISSQLEIEIKTGRLIDFEKIFNKNRQKFGQRGHLRAPLQQLGMARTFKVERISR